MTIVRQEDQLIEIEDDHICGVRHTHWISEPGGLTQLGAFAQVLPPGSFSSIKHWHSAEDELVYVLDGEVTLIEGEVKTVLCAGDAATFRAGVAAGHHLANTSDRPARYLVVGTRAPIDVIIYPDHDRVCHRDRSLPDDSWTDGQGQPASNPYNGGPANGQGG
jgi:uncharacterized cupin superfamily protein